MSISTVVTHGFGTYSTVNFVPTHGYSIGATPPPSGGSPGIVTTGGDLSIFRLKGGISPSDTSGIVSHYIGLVLGNLTRQWADVFSVVESGLSLIL